MAKLAPVRFRSQQSFGLAGVLQQDCQIFYHALFHSRQLGRITDLLVARFRQAGVDEGRLRTVLTASLSHGLSGLLDGNGEPCMLEVGIDSQSVGIGISFDLKSDLTPGVLDRVKQLHPTTSFEMMLLQWALCSEHIILRHQESSKRIEIISLQNINHGMPVEGRLENLSDRMQWIRLEKQLEAEAKAGAYLELGDLDYGKLLQDEITVLGKTIPAGEFMQTVVANQNHRDDILNMTVSGNSLSNEDLTKVEGPSHGSNEEVVLVQDTKSEQEPRSSWSRFGSYLKNLVLGKNETAIPHEQEPAKKDEPLTSTILDSTSTIETVPLETGEMPSKEIEGVDASIQRIESQARAIKDEIKTSRAKEMLDGLMGELTVQKSQLREASRLMQLNMTKRELAIKSERQSMQEMLRKSELVIRQKESALAVTKEQLNTVSAHLDRARAGATSQNNESPLKKKYDKAVEEAQRLTFENEALKKKLDSVRLNGVGTREKSTLQIELGTLKEKYARTVRQMEELKRQNNSIMGRVQQERSQQTAGQSDAARIKLEQAVRLANERKIEVDHQRERLSKMEQEDLRQKRKIQELRNQLAQLAGQSAKKNSAA